MTAVCGRCRAPLAPNVLEGLCPRCLLRLAADSLPREPAPPQQPTGFVPPTVADLALLFPHLEVIELVGQGGMGAVYKARQIKLDRLVALKVLPPAIAREAGFADRFCREARTLARLDHPNIVGIHDFGEVSELYYLVMEFVDGVDLRRLMTAGNVQPQQALAIVGALCSALQYAHELGVVHRDIKPENILLDRSGRVKVADFGLARLVGQGQPERLTATGQAMGTPHYMAPEQMERPLAVDHRADVYSLGVVFYELLTGELPIGRFAPPSKMAGVDARLDSVVLRAIEKQPEQRYQKMSEMKTAVEDAAQPSPSMGGLLGWVVSLALGSFMRSGSSSVSQDESEETIPAHGLTAREEKLRRVLLSAVEEVSFELSVLPEIDSTILATARKRCKVAPDDRILAVVDFSNGEGEAGLLFGCGGLYWRNGDDTPHPGAGLLAYAELAGRRLVNHGDVVYLGKEQFLCPTPDETGIDCEELVRILSKVRETMGEATV